MVRIRMRSSDIVCIDVVAAADTFKPLHGDDTVHLVPELATLDLQLEPEPTHRAYQQVVRDRPPLELNPVERRTRGVYLLIEYVARGLDQ